MVDRSLTRRDGRPSVGTRFTSARDGDLAVDLDPDELNVRRATIAPTPWTWLRQVHGADVVRVDAPGQHAGAAADAAVTAAIGATLAVNTADCAGVVMTGLGDRVTAVGAAHAGWRGLYVGVLQATADALRDLGATEIHWQLGPCISPSAYEFGDPELDLLAERYGSAVRSTTVDGAPALDLRAGVRAAMAEAGAIASAVAGDGTPGTPCTATDPGYFSWRARQDTGRQASVIWLEATAGVAA